MKRVCWSQVPSLNQKLLATSLQTIRYRRTAYINHYRGVEVGNEWGMFLMGEGGFPPFQQQANALK